MNKSIYGFLSYGDRLEEVPICPIPPSDVTIDRIVEYMNRATSILIGLVQDGNREKALGRLNVIRQEIAILTNTPYIPLTVTTSIMGSLHPDPVPAPPE